MTLKIFSAMFNKKWLQICFEILIYFISTILCIGQTQKEKPNIIIFVTDDQGYADVGYNGNDKIITPELDQMAKESLVFNRCYTAPVCSPTRAGILTGRYPTRAGVFYWGHALRPQELTIAEVLKKEGYQTAFFGKWHLGSVRKDQPTTPGAQGFETWYAAANFYENDPWMSHNGQPVHLKGESSVMTVDLALDYINTASQNDAPFLVFIWAGSPHIPHQAKEELKNLYPDEPDEMQNYMGEITGIDQSIGVLKEGLKGLNIDQETVLWFSSDNGGRLPHANNGVLRDHKGTLYEGGVRVPAMVYWPGHIKSGTTDMPVSTIDLFPTIMDLIGVKEGDFDYPIYGESMIPLWKDPTHPRKKPLGFWVYPEIKGHGVKSDQIISDYNDILQGTGSLENINDGILNTPEQDYVGLDHFPYSGTSVWMDGSWKLLQTTDGFELYDLENDPSEINDLVKNYPKKVKKMKKLLKKWQKSVVGSIKGKDYK